MQVVRRSCLVAQSQHFPEEGPWIGPSIIRQLASNHSGFEALMLPIAAASPSADLVYKQSQLALKAPKVGFPLLEATGHVRACLQPYNMGSCILTTIALCP